VTIVDDIDEKFVDADEIEEVVKKPKAKKK